MTRSRIGVVFGGQSVEHEVSVLTAQQVMAALPADRYECVPLYISKTGRWFTGDSLRVLDTFHRIDDVARQAVAVSPIVDASAPGRLRVLEARRSRFSRAADADITIDLLLPLVHGSGGEDGTLAALAELWGVAYAGSGVAAGAVSMDKPLSKQLFRAAGLPVLDEVVVSRDDFRAHATDVVARVEARLAYPLFVKPATLGSSIGVAPAADRPELQGALEVAFVYADRVVIEPRQSDIVEINCAVIGRGTDLRASVLEQPLTAGVLTYADKYAGGGKGKQGRGGMKNSQRIIPAPVDDALRDRIQELARQAFAAVGAAGVARVDFLVRPATHEIILNEINTLPGSLAFYLWEAAGMAFDMLITTLIEMGFAAHAERNESTRSIDSWLLANAAGGTKTSTAPR